MRLRLVVQAVYDISVSLRKSGASSSGPSLDKSYQLLDAACLPLGSVSAISASVPSAVKSVPYMTGSSQDVVAKTPAAAVAEPANSTQAQAVEAGEFAEQPHALKKKRSRWD